MTAKNFIRLTEKKLFSLLRALTVLLIPFVTTAVLAMLQLLTGTDESMPFWDICSMVLALVPWLGAVLAARGGLLGDKMPKTALVLSGCLLLSVLFYALSFAMEKEILTFHAAIWAIGRLIGTPAYVTTGGIGLLFGGVEEGTGAMLSGGLWLVVSLIAVLPMGKKKK